MIPQRVIVVEDEYLVALDVETVLLAAGIGSVVIATTLAQATAAIAEGRPDCILLDVSLSDGTSYDLARHLRANSIPFGFVSGYSNTRDFPPDMVDVPLLGKPFGEKELLDFVADLLLLRAS